MPNTVQTHFFTKLDNALRHYDQELLVAYDASNTGRATVVQEGGFTELFSFTFHFQNGHTRFESASPIFDGGGNPRMHIAKDVTEVGTAFTAIVREARLTHEAQLEDEMAE
jgi:hypothetical protein